MNNRLKTFYINEFNREGAVYHSPAIDGGDSDMTWHRLTIAFDAETGGRIRIACYASNNIREAFTKNAFVFAFDNPHDILLHDAVGRYFWFSIEFSGTAQVVIRHAYVNYPAVSPLEYLPDVYRDNDFADRFLSIFMALYDDAEKLIEHSSALYDADCAPDSFVFLMAEWIAVPSLFLWNAAGLRRLLHCATELYRIKGTLEGIRRIISLYTGGRVKVFFVETYHAMRYYSSFVGKSYERLYSNDRHSFWTLIDGDIDENTEKSLEYLLLQNKPAHTNAHLISLKPCLITDAYVYLGINSVLSEYNEACLNKESLVNYIILGG